MRCACSESFDMVRVNGVTIDKATAWRIRDELAAHPLLGGATAQIDVAADADGVVLTGWTSDEALLEIAARLAARAAGHRPIRLQVQPRRTNGGKVLHC